jgi:hypothetical protein
VPLYTTAAEYPWYKTAQPLSLSLTSPSKTQFVDPDPNAPSNNIFFKYRFVVNRAGVFHRYEEDSDFNDADDADEDAGGGGIAMDTGMEVDTTQRTTTATDSSSSSSSQLFHSLPLRLLANRESYVVNDVLGKTTAAPYINHNRLEPTGFGAVGSSPSVASLHSRSSSFGKAPSFSQVGSQAKMGSGSALNTVGGGSSGATAARKRAVGFAPSPPPYHRAKDPTAVQAVHLNSTDGLVVVSAFLPVVLHRSDQGQWTADWDYEVLLSMQTHLRVTRIGVVKWRGWHGNTGSKGSPEAGVPVNERHLVEDCLRFFNCVPVWMDTALFGEM